MEKKTFRYLVFLITATGIVSLILLWFIKFPSSQAVELLSPLATGKIMDPTTDPLYGKIMSGHTVDKFPANDYFPNSLNIADKSDLGIDAEAYIAIDRDSRQILLGKNITKRLPIASLTKITTAIVSLENSSLDWKLVVSSASANIGEAAMGLASGEKISVEDALYGLLLPSGNDAAEALAEGIGKYKLGTPVNQTDGGGARGWFLKAMNEKAQGLGMFDTYFFNPSGLDEDKKEDNNFSTVLDLAALTNYALDNKTFAEMVDTREKDIPYKEGRHKAFYLYNILTLSDAYPGIKGVKPGISDLAGETLSSYIEKNGRRIIVIILGSQHTKDDVVKIYDRIFGKR